MRNSRLCTSVFLALFVLGATLRPINAASPSGVQFVSKQAQSPGSDTPADPEGDAASLEAIELYRQGRYAPALSKAQTALTLREKAFGKNHEMYAAALYNLATVQLALTQYENARKGFEQTVKIQEACGADAEQVCNSLNKLASASYAVGRTIDAKKALEREIALREAAGGPDASSLLTPLKNLAQVYEYQGEYEKAAQTHTRRTQIFENDFRRKALPTDQEKNLFTEALEGCACAWRQAKNKKEVKRFENLLERITGKRLLFFSTYETDDHEDESVHIGKASKRVLPEYPQAARAMGVSGDVIVRFSIDETGRINDIKVQCGHPLLRQASEEAARQWEFKPTLVDGKPSSVIGFATFRFTAPPGVKTKVR
jgi:TonB family protein